MIINVYARWITDHRFTEFFPYKRPEGGMVSAAEVIRRPLKGVTFKPGYGNWISLEVAHGCFEHVRINMQLVGAGSLAGNRRNRMNAHFRQPSRVFK